MKTLIFVLLLMIQAPILFGATESKRANRSKCDTNRISTLLELSREYGAHNIYKAERFANNALKIALTANDKKQLTKVYMTLGYLNHLKENETETLDFFFKSLDLAEKINDKKSICQIYNNIGASYSLYNDTAKALAYLKKSLVIAHSINDKGLLAAQYNNLGLVFEEAKQYDTALYYYNQSLEINLTQHNTTGLTRNYANIGSVLLKQNKPDSAYIYIRKQLAKSELVDDHLIKTNAYTAMANYFSETGKFNKAVLYADSALNLALSSGYSGALRELYLIKAKSLHKTGQHDLAILYFEKLYEQLDSTRSKRIKELTSSLNVKKIYEDQKKQDELKQSMLLVEQRETELKYLSIVGSLIIVSLIFAIIYLTLLKKNRKGAIQHKILKEEKQKIENELEFKNKELTTNVMEMINRNEILNNSIERLEKGKKKIGKENHDILNSVIKELKSGLKENVWDEFKVRFQNVHSGFRKNLQIKHADLTPNEKKLCSFLKLNMSSKEISSLTGQSVHSIEVARTRLRKKLGIANSKVNLITYINKI